LKLLKAIRSDKTFNVANNSSNFVFIDEGEALTWLQNKNVGVLSNNRPVRPRGQFHSTFKIPAYPRGQIVLAWHLAKCFSNKNGMLLLTEWPIYTESEMTVFLEARMQHGESRRLIEAPGCRFSLGDLSSVRFIAEIMSLMFAFNWEGFLYAEDLSVTIWLADEIIEMASSTSEISLQLQDALDDLYIIPLDRT
jgi:hypothetical protein